MRGHDESRGQANSSTLGALVFNGFFRGAMLPGFATVVLLLITYYAINRHVAEDNRTKLLEQVTRDAQTLASHEVMLIDRHFSEVARLVSIMRRDHEAFFTRMHAADASSDCPLPNGEPRFAVHENGAFHKVIDNGGSSVYYAKRTPIGPAQLLQARCSEALDPLMRAIVDESVVVTQAWINTSDYMDRVYPFVVDTPVRYGPDLDLKSFNYYYLAEPRLNPSRGRVWSPTYVDPAGQGWMVSVSVPIYSGDVLEGVSGLDVTVEQVTKHILELQMPWGSGAALVDDKGAVLAMQSRFGQILGLKDVPPFVYTKEVAREILQSSEYNLLKHGGERLRAQFARLLDASERLSDLELDGKHYVVSQERVNETGWRMLTLVDRSALFSPIDSMQTRIDRIGLATLSALALVWLLFFAWLMRRSRKLAMAISTPVTSLSLATQRLVEDPSQRVDAHSGIDELDSLGAHFNRMADQLDVRTRALIEAREASERASDAKRTFTSTMSHELLTPLNGTIGMITVAMLRISDPDVRDRLEKAQHSARALMAMIRSVLDISAFDAREIAIERRPFRLREVFEQVIPPLQSMATEKGLDFRVDATDAVISREWTGDAARVGQVLNHVGHNAIRFTDAGGVCVRVRADDGTGTDRVRIEVIDTGPGIPPDFQQRVFDDFEQYDGSLTRQHGGAGLGLSISRRLVELMGGDIGLTSTPGSGTTLWFTLPMDGTAVRSPAAATTTG